MLYIGLDGGGTKTAAVAMDRDGTVLAEARSGGINYNFMPMEDAADNVVDVLDKLNLSQKKDIVISIGHPSLDDGFQSEAEVKFVEMLKEKLSGKYEAEIVMKSDVYMALYALTLGKPGIMVIGGTGSIGVGIDSKGEVYTVGGWGFPTNDDGSAYSVAVDGLRAVFDECDQIGEKTLITDAALEFYNVSKARELIDELNGKGLTKTDVAKFAVKVSESAQKGDRIAIDILRKAGHSLTQYAKALMKIIGEPVEIIGMTGGVLKNDNIVREYFINELKSQYGDVTIEFPSVTPEYGAAYYAINKF